MTFNLIMLFLDMGLGCFGIWALAHSKVKVTMSQVFIFGFWLSCVGLIGQAFRHILFFYYQQSLTDDQLPIWILKDVGIWIMVFSSITYSQKIKQLYLLAMGAGIALIVGLNLNLSLFSLQQFDRANSVMSVIFTSAVGIQFYKRWINN